MENPKEDTIYRRCKDDIQEKCVTQEKLIEVMVSCCCSLYNESFTTTMITSDNCVKNIKVKLYNPIDNVIFLRLLLNNRTIESNIATNLIPKLHLANLIKKIMVKDENKLLNLKDVLKAYRSQYYHTAINTLTRQETLTKEFSIFKINAMITPIFRIILISVIIFVCCRTKKIGQLVSLLSLSKVTKASPLKEIDECEFDTFTSVLIIIILCVWIVYLSIRYYKLGRRVFNHLSLPCTECISAKRPDKLRLILHLSNFNNYGYLYITEIITYPDLIVTQSQDNNLYVTFHSSFCNPYLTISNKVITLISKDYRYIIPGAIAIPNILKHIVRTILNKH